VLIWFNLRALLYKKSPAETTASLVLTLAELEKPPRVPIAFKLALTERYGNNKPADLPLPGALKCWERFMLGIELTLGFVLPTSLRSMGLRRTWEPRL